jgi:hypothetical protein
MFDNFVWNDPASWVSLLDFANGDPFLIGLAILAAIGAVTILTRFLSAIPVLFIVGGFALFFFFGDSVFQVFI